MLKLLACFIVVAAATDSVRAAESHALAISDNIRARHMPYGTVMDPVFASPTSNTIVSYSRAGDSGIWTGHYLAAEAFRYSVTRSSAALANVRAAISGIRALVDITGTNLLARCIVPVNSPYAAAITSEEAGNGVYTASLGGVSYYWIGNTSRDQYSGVFFGLAVAYDFVDDPTVRSAAADLVTRMLNFLLARNWSVVMPNGQVSTTFLHRPDQKLTLLQIGRRLNSARFGPVYSATAVGESSSVWIPIGAEVLDDHGSYFKFNLDTINLYNLIRLEPPGTYHRARYQDAYDLLRRTTDDHANAHFNMIDRGLKGPDPTRDANTRAYLDAWLQRPRRDFYVDLRSRYPACGAPDRSCTVIPVAERVRTDFLLQRSPFLLYGGGQGSIETAGIDYILPYWMGRHYGTIPANTAPSAVSVTPNSGTGASQTFAFAFSDPDGYTDMPFASIVANEVLAPNRSCYTYFDRASNSIYLMNDAGSAWFGPARLGTATTLANSQCRLTVGASSSTGSGANLTLRLALTFLQRGAKAIYTYTQDSTGLNTGWQQRGTWTVP